jgi:NADPH:quinone reductase
VVHQGSAGESALVHAAAGGTGSLLVQFLLQQGVTVLASASSDRKAAHLRGIGVEHVINSGRVDVVEAVHAIVPDGVDVVFDSVGRVTFEASLRAVRPRGLVVAFGQSSGPVPPMDVARLSGLTGERLPGSIWLTWPALVDYNSTREALAHRAAVVFEAALNSSIQPMIAESLPLQHAARAHELLEARAVIGRSSSKSDPVQCGLPAARRRRPDRGDGRDPPSPGVADRQPCWMAASVCAASRVAG